MLFVTDSITFQLFVMANLAFTLLAAFTAHRLASSDGGKILRQRAENLRDDLNAPRPSQQTPSLGRVQVPHIRVVSRKTEQPGTN
jgi:hypothetical protein